MDDDFGDAAGLASDVSVAGARLEIFREADADLLQEAAAAGDRDGGGGDAGVGGDELFGDDGRGDGAGVLGAAERGRDLQGLEGAAGAVEVLVGGASGADAVFGPFVADETGAGHDVEHLVDDAFGEGLVGFAELGPAALVLGPETVDDEIVLSGAVALHAVAFAGRGGAVLGRPGEGEEIEVEFAGFTPGGVAALGREEGGQEEQQAEQTHVPTTLQ